VAEKKPTKHYRWQKLTFGSAVAGASVGEAFCKSLSF